MAGYGYGYFQGGVPIGSNVNQKDPDFIITIDTTKAGSASNTFVFPLTAKTAEDVVIDWGDGNTNTYTTTGNKSHTYAAAGTYQVKVGGGMTAFSFNNAGDKLKVLYIDNWGSTAWSSMYNMFDGCSNMQGRYVDHPNTSNVITMERMFANCSVFNQSINDFDTSKVENMRLMMVSCLSYNQSMNNFDTSKVVSMYGILAYCNLFKQPLGSFNLHNANNISGLLVAVNLNEPNSTTNYDNTLISWANNPTTPNNLNFDGGFSKYGSGAGAAARATLISKGWTITDGGLLV